MVIISYPYNIGYLLTKIGEKVSADNGRLDQLQSEVVILSVPECTQLLYICMVR